jgi:hypothetical protein
MSNPTGVTVRYIRNGATGKQRQYFDDCYIDRSLAEQKYFYPSTYGAFLNINKEVLQGVTRVTIRFEYGVLEHIVHPDGRISEGKKLLENVAKGKLGIIWSGE